MFYNYLVVLSSKVLSVIHVNDGLTGKDVNEFRKFLGKLKFRSHNRINIHLTEIKYVTKFSD